MRDFEATYDGITFYGKTMAAAQFQVLQYRLSTAIDNANHTEKLSYTNILAHHKNGTLGAFLCSLTGSELAETLVNTVAARSTYTVTEVYAKYAAIMDAYQSEVARMELVKIESEYGCPEARAEMKSYAALTRFI